MHVDDAASSNCQALFWGNTRGRLRTDIFKHLQALNKPDWSLESTGQVTPRKYMELMASSKFCLHVRGTRVQSPRLIEVGRCRLTLSNPR